MVTLPLQVEEAAALYEAHEAAHAFDHVLRVYRLAEGIGRAEGADLRVVLTAALLHDVIHTGSDHHLRSAARAREILRHEPSDFVDAVVHCIEAHRFRTGPSPRTLEAQVLHDADKLDAIGAIGVARAFAYAGYHGNRLWAPLAEVCQHPAPSGEAYTPVHEFWHKLQHLAQRLYTPTARRIAKERHAFMVAFFQRLDQECQGEK